MPLEYVDPTKMFPVVSETRVGETAGYKVCISADGTTALLTAVVEDLAYVLVKDGAEWVTQAVLAPTEADGPTFGYSAALSADGNTAAIGGPSDGRVTDGPELAGAVWVFIRVDGVWLEGDDIIKITTPDFETDSAFGWSVALSADGNTMLVGDPREYRECTVWREIPPINEQLEDVKGAGSAYVLTRFAGNWSNQWKLFPDDDGPYRNLNAEPDPTEGAAFGTHVALSADGNIAVVVGPNNYEAFEYDAGTFLGSWWTFKRDDDAWVQASEPQSSAFGTGELGYGAAIAADGLSAVVTGAALDGTDHLADVWFYSLTEEGDPTFLNTAIIGPAEMSTSAFARSVASSADGTVVIVGGGYIIGSGEIPPYFTFSRLWQYENGELIGRIDEPEDGGDELAFGASVALALDPSTLLVGAPGEGDPAFQGAAYIFNSRVLAVSLDVRVPLN